MHCMNECVDQHSEKTLSFHLLCFESVSFIPAQCRNEGEGPALKCEITSKECNRELKDFFSRVVTAPLQEQTVTMNSWDAS